jgi:NitT/TauT family transport system permease protein
MSVHASTSPQTDDALPAWAFGLFLVSLALAWLGASALVGPQVLPGPIETFDRLWVMLSTERFEQHAWETFRAFIVALMIAVLLGIVLGVTLGAHRLSGDVAEPMLVALYSIPKVTLYPIILLLFGLGLSAKVAFGVIHGIIPICIFTMAAVRAVPRRYVRAAQAMRLSPREMFWKIYLPACIPEVFSGLRVGFSLTLLGTIIGEMFASQRGIGHLLHQAMENNNLLDITAMVLLLVTLAASVGFALLTIDRRLAARAPSA